MSRLILIGSSLAAGSLLGQGYWGYGMILVGLSVSVAVLLIRGSYDQTKEIE